MKLRIAAAGLLAVALVLAGPGAAQAKGATGASIKGPGLEQPIELSQLYTDPGPSGTTVVAHTRANEIAFGVWPEVPLAATRPGGELGPRYVLELSFFGPSGPDDHVLRQHVYPYAENGPVVHTPIGQQIYDRTIRGGWLQAPSALRADLVALGLPPSAPAPPQPSSSPSEGRVEASGPLLGAILVAVVALAPTGIFWARRRRRPGIGVISG